jgi:hypothetical protein
VTYKIPVQFNSVVRKGKVKREIRSICIDAPDCVEAQRLARHEASKMLGKRIANVLCQVFTVRSVEVRMDLFKGGL